MACTTPVHHEETLYQRLGGTAVVTAIVDATIDRAATDPRTRRSFQKVDMKRLKLKIVEQICALTEGGCKYSGDPMKESHAGLNITEAEFYLTVQFLRDALDARVGEREKNELLRLLAPMKRDIVTG
jgi:hemoglobin